MKLTGLGYTLSGKDLDPNSAAAKPYLARHSSENEKPPSTVQDSDNRALTSTKDGDEKGVQDLSVGVVKDQSPLENKPTITSAAITHDTTGPPTPYVKLYMFHCKKGSVLISLLHPPPKKMMNDRLTPLTLIAEKSQRSPPIMHGFKKPSTMKMAVPAIPSHDYDNRAKEVL